MANLVIIYYLFILGFGLLGLVWLGVRSENQKKERLLKEALRNLNLVSIARGNRKR